MNIIQSQKFEKTVKKLHKNQKQNLDDAIREVIKHPAIGEMKKGDLSGVRVYKFYMVKQLTLLAYSESEDEIHLLALGEHENFYRDLKN